MHYLDPIIHVPKLDNPARTFCDKVRTQIGRVEETLAAGESIVLTHSSAFGAVTVTDVAFQGLDMIVLSGIDSVGRVCKLLVHLHAVNLMITPVRGVEQRRPIGFSGEIGGAPDAATGT
jgi:hypothetical protein